MTFLTLIKKECKEVERKMKEKDEKAAAARTSNMAKKLFIPKLTFKKSNTNVLDESECKSSPRS